MDIAEAERIDCAWLVQFNSYYGTVMCICRSFVCSLNRFAMCCKFAGCHVIGEFSCLRVEKDLNPAYTLSIRFYFRKLCALDRDSHHQPFLIKNKTHNWILTSQRSYRYLSTYFYQGYIPVNTCFPAFTVTKLL